MREELPKNSSNISQKSQLGWWKTQLGSYTLVDVDERQLIFGSTIDYKSGKGEIADEVLPHQAMRQWVLSVPFPLCFLFASNPKAGIPAAAVLKMATPDSARIVGVDEHTGSIAVGKASDLVLIDGNRFEDISAVRRATLVMKGDTL